MADIFGSNAGLLSNPGFDKLQRFQPSSPMPAAPQAPDGLRAPAMMPPQVQQAMQGQGGAGAPASPPDLAKLSALVKHPVYAHTNGVFGFPFAGMPVGGSPNDWQSWAGNVQNWAQNLRPQIQSWAQTHGANNANPFVWPWPGR